MQFFGALTALVTPFKNGAVDEAAYREFIEFQISEGIHGLVPCGTTGESATLSHEMNPSNPSCKQPGRNVNGNCMAMQISLNGI